MKWFRISKYDPAFRDIDGKYLKKDWTSFTDIGKEYGGNKLTVDQYIEVEDQYISFLLCLFDLLDVQKIQITETENEILNSDNEYQFPEILNDRNTIIDVIRNILREKIWGKLISKNKIEIHFGYDFYMYVGISKNFDKNVSACQKNKDNIFIEKIDTSPYSKT